MSGFRTKQKRYDERGNDKWETYSQACYDKICDGKCEMKDCKCDCHTITQESQS